MSDLLACVILAGHFGLLFVLCIYGGHRLMLTWIAYRSAGGVEPEPAPARSADELPIVTVQLPIFNERYVVERLIDAVAALSYPADRLQIQVLDDSTDETSTLAAARIEHHRTRGCWIEHLQRSDRTGFKAGALAAAMLLARGELIAIFDADFVPGPDLLARGIAPFADRLVGMVQTRWLHLNRNYNTLTQVQAIMLDAHFAIDQVARSRSGLFFNFNGTAGIWRADTIREAGGWRWDTITEDLDLSYRAQLIGWRFVYLPGIGCPSELPVEMTAFKSQQHRWAKGSIQVAMKILPRLWRSPLGLPIKVEATLHLSSNLAYLLMLVHSAVFLLPSILIRQQSGWLPWFWLDLPLLLLATGSHVFFFLAGQRDSFGALGKQLFYAPALLSTAIGLGLNNGRAVVQALLGRHSVFVRTPKLGNHALRNLGLQARPRTYAQRLQGHERMEIGLAVLYGAYIVWALACGWWGVVPFLLLFVAGFWYSGTQSLRERRIPELAS